MGQEPQAGNAMGLKKLDRAKDSVKASWERLSELRTLDFVFLAIWFNMLNQVIDAIFKAFGL